VGEASTMIEHSFRAMGGPCRLRLEVEGRELAAKAIECAVTEVQRLEQKYSRYQPDSLVSQINHSAGTGKPVLIDDETVGLLGYADTLYRESQGLFDLTSGVLRQAWDFASGLMPTTAELDELLPLVGWQQVRWDDDSITLPQAGMELDFGGMVKEYACDAAAAALRAAGVNHGLVDLAGDMAVTGQRAAGQPWMIGIRHPREPGRAVAQIPLVSGGLASSGDYERCLLIDGKRYGHIINPFTGLPGSGLVAVSVASAQCLVAGSVATVAMLKPLAEALPWLESLGVAWLGVDAELCCHGTGMGNNG